MGGVSKETVSAFGHKIKKSDLFKLVGLVCFIALVFGIVAALWPSLSLIFEPDGLDQMIESIQSQGPVGVLILLGLQLLQIIVAFIPGEVVQVAAGMLYGPLFGTLIILLGCVISSSLIYTLVHKLGAPFVRAMVDEKHLVSLIIFGIAAVLMILGIIFRDKIMSVLGTQRALHKMDKEREEKQVEKTLRESLQQEDEKRVE